MSCKYWMALVAASAVVLGSMRPSQAAERHAILTSLYAYPGSCTGPYPEGEGEDYFRVNGVPVPTYSSGPYELWSDGHQTNHWEAPFSGTLLKDGTNRIYAGFGTIPGNEDCTKLDIDVSLLSKFVPLRLLFRFQHYFTDLSEGTAEVEISLDEIDPELAEDIRRLRDEIEDEIRRLRDISGPAANAAEDIERLNALLDELDALLALGFDGITHAMLDNLLRRYQDVIPSSLRERLVKVLDDLKKNVDELREELQRISDTFRERTDAVTEVVDTEILDPSSPEAFEPLGDPDTVPPVEVPDIIGEDPFDPENDPYANFADDVIAQLESTVGDGAVVQRASFLNIVASWRQNLDALELGLMYREGVSAAEYGAFLVAKGRVTQFIEQYVDSRGWFNDTAVPPHMRDWVDLVVALRSFDQAKRLKWAMNGWEPELTPRQQAILDVLYLIEAASEEAWPNPPKVDAKEQATIDSLLWGVVESAVLGAIEFSPLGDVKDACEFVTGWENCNPSGRSLTLTERALSGAGILIGSGAMWRRAGNLVQGAADCVESFRAGAGIACKAAKKAAEALSKAIDEVRKYKPSINNPNIVAEIPLSGGRVKYLHIEGFEVIYDHRGFPDFSPFLRAANDGKKSDVLIDLAAPPNRLEDFKRANIKAGFCTPTGPCPASSTPDGFVWHHHQDLGRMQLVRKDVHNVAEGGLPHTGSFAYWKVIYEATGN